MKILYGIKSGALLQRNKNNVSETVFSADAVGRVRAAECEVEQIGIDEYKLTGLPLGGPYSVTVYDENDSIKLDNLYVGDLWLLGGQSNMEGVGRLTEEDIAYTKNPDRKIRTYGFSDEWSPAIPRLHIYKDSKNDAPTMRFWENCIDIWSKSQCPVDEYPNERVRCVGPGLYFARRMAELTGIPQGVIPCGFGGAAIEDWNADRPNSFCATACSRIKLCGGKISGMFWYQGESDAMLGTDLNVFLEKYKAVLKKLGVFTDGVLPTVQAQIAAVNAFGGDVHANDRWSKLKDLQYRMDGFTPKMATVSTLDGQLEDLIHLTSDSQKKLGKRDAEAMYNMLTYGDGKLPAVESVTFEPDVLTPFWSNIRIKYKNVGNLSFVYRACGYTMRNKDGGEMPVASGLARMWTEGDCVVIRTETPEEKLKEKELWYAWGAEPFGTLVTESGEPLPTHRIKLGE